MGSSEVAVAEHRNPATLLPGKDDLETIGLENLHGSFPHIDLVRIGETSVKIGDLLFALGAMLSEPLAKGWRLVGWKDSSSIDLEGHVEKPAKGPVLQEEVDDGRKHGT
jgi:hypothetical protein